MKNNFRIFSFLLFSAMFFSCASIPRTMGPYIETDSKKTASKNAKNQQQAQQQTIQQSQAQTQPQSQPQLPQKNYAAKEEVFSMISISDAPLLKAYSIVVGSFSVEENAKKLKKSLEPDYNPIIVINGQGMFRVILVSFDTYDAAKEELINSIIYRFTDAWILTQKR